MNEEYEVKTSEPEILIENPLEPMETHPIQATELNPQNNVPSMNVNVQMPEPEAKLISDEQLMGIYDEIMNDLREDRKEIGEVALDFMEKVINDGDATNSSKETLARLLEAKANIADKKSKIADLMTRLHMKEKNTYPGPFMNTQQNIFVGPSRKNLIEQEVAKMKKGKK